MHLSRLNEELLENLKKMQMKITYLNNQNTNKNANNFNYQLNNHINENNFYDKNSIFEIENDLSNINTKKIKNNSESFDYNQYKNDNYPQSISKKFNVTPNDVYSLRENREETREINGGKNINNRNGNYDFL